MLLLLDELSNCGRRGTVFNLFFSFFFFWQLLRLIKGEIGLLSFLPWNVDQSDQICRVSAFRWWSFASIFGLF